MTDKNKKKTPRPRAQHWVPYFYLRYFATPDTINTDIPKVHVFNKLDAKPESVLMSVSKVAIQNHLYTPPNASGQRSWSTEDELCGLEGLLGRIWNNVANDYVDLRNESIKKGMSLFIATLMLRNPKEIQAHQDIQRQIIELRTSLQKDHAGRVNKTIIIEGCPARLDLDSTEYHEYSTLDRNGIQALFVDNIIPSTTTIAEILLKKRWSIWLAETPTFVTSDYPVLLENLSVANFGLGTKGTMVIFPLSPTRLLILDDRTDAEDGLYYKASTKDAGGASLLNIKHALRFVYSSYSPDMMCLRLVQWADEYKKSHRFQFYRYAIKEWCSKWSSPK